MSAGLTATAALVGLLLLVSQLSAASFAPLDISDALIRLTPGTIATQGIESLGPLAKQLIELTGILVFIGAGGLVGALYGRAAPRPWLAAGLALALVPLVLTRCAAAGGRAARRGGGPCANRAALRALGAGPGRDREPAGGAGARRCARGR
jgi:hypothetical protein